MQVSFQQEGNRCQRGARSLGLAAHPAAGEQRRRRGTAYAKPAPPEQQPRRAPPHRNRLSSRWQPAKRCSPVCRSNERIIVGAYVDRDGGVCPMLAAHRQGGRTDFLTFARLLGPLHARLRRLAPRHRARGADPASRSSKTASSARAGSSSMPRSGSTANSRAGASVPARRLLDSADPRGEIIARRLRRPSTPRPGRDRSARSGERRLILTRA